MKQRYRVLGGVVLAAVIAALWAWAPRKSLMQPEPVESQLADEGAIQTGNSMDRRQTLLTPSAVLGKIERPNSDTRSIDKAAATLLSIAEGLQGAPGEDEVRRWRESVQELVKNGQASIPAILGVLSLNKDWDFSPQTAALLGDKSLRRSLLNALTAIGGDAGLNALRQVLQDTGDPREIAFLAKSVDTMRPGEYVDDFLKAAREGLAMAKGDRLNGFDVAPLFEVYQQYGGTENVTEMQEAAKSWAHYATISLSKVPDSAGLPALIQLAEDAGSPAKLAATQALATLATESEDARASLLRQAQTGKIPSSHWAYLAHSLSGEEVQFVNAELSAPSDAPNARQNSHLNKSNENYRWVPNTALNDSQLEQRLQLLNDFRTLAPSDEARNSIDHAKDLLIKRMKTSQVAVIQ